MKRIVIFFADFFQLYADAMIHFLIVCWLFVVENIFANDEFSSVVANTCTGITPGGNCLSYDRRYQADSIREAIENFPDLTLTDDSTATCEVSQFNK